MKAFGRQVMEYLRWYNRDEKCKLQSANWCWVAMSLLHRSIVQDCLWRWRCWRDRWRKVLQDSLRSDPVGAPKLLDTILDLWGYTVCRLQPKKDKMRQFMRLSKMRILCTWEECNWLYIMLDVQANSTTESVCPWFQFELRVVHSLSLNYGFSWFILQ